jgi:branched-chain amino acid transport system permease protein
MGLVVQTIANAGITSAFFAIIAVGFSLVFGVMRVANYSHGVFFMLGAYIVWLLYSEGSFPFFVAVLAALVLVGLLGMGTERILFRRMRGDIIGGAVISIGLMFAIEASVAQIWGVGLPKPVPAAIPGALEVMGVSVGWQRVAIVPGTIAMLGLLWVFLNRTRLGRAVRASAMDSEAASLQGISINRSGLVALGFGAALAGMGGALMAPVLAVTPYMGDFPLLMCFIIVITGGAGSLKGAVLASILFGFIYTIVSTVAESFIAIIVMLVAMFILLAIRPQGLAGYAEK